jgi:hypothetical protein
VVGAEHVVAVAVVASVYTLYHIIACVHLCSNPGLATSIKSAYLQCFCSDWHHIDVADEQHGPQLLLAAVPRQQVAQRAAANLLQVRVGAEGIFTCPEIDRASQCMTMALAKICSTNRGEQGNWLRVKHMHTGIGCDVQLPR